MQRLMASLLWAWRDIESDALGYIRSWEGVPAQTASVSVQLDGAMKLLLLGHSVSYRTRPARIVTR